jgi:8-oxo-dGTP pyrophosphatase MutT (NUDIX family)
MVAASLLPFSFCHGELVFLFGKQNNLKESAPFGFSDFGGGVESGEKLFECALREGSEELSGFLGDAQALKTHIRKHGGTFHIVHAPTPNAAYHVYLFYLPYDAHLVSHFNQNHEFLWKRMDKKMLNDSKCFEKIEIDWFTEKDILARKKQFRFFYKDILDHILAKKEAIASFGHRCQSQAQHALSPKRKTRRKRGG